MRNYFQATLICIFIYSTVWAQPTLTIDWKKVAVLVYSKNGKGYVHENIPYAVKAIQQMGKEYGFKVDTSSDPGIMEKKNLRKYTMLIFPSTNNDVFDTDEQRLAFRQYVEAGGGFVGIHSVTGTERNWRWFKMMLGGTFSWHAKFQKYTVRVIDTKHPSMKETPTIWQKADECYFAKELYPGPRVLMVNDFSTIDTSDVKQRETLKKNAGNYSTYFPSAWEHDFDGGHTWCTTLGHDKNDYTDTVFLKHIFGGIRFIASRVKSLDYSKAYATHRDDEVHY